MRKILIENSGNIGNYLFKYMLGYKLSKELGLPIFIYGDLRKKLPEFLKNTQLSRIDTYDPSIKDNKISKQNFDLNTLLNNESNILIETLCCHISYYEQYIDYFRSLIPQRDVDYFDEHHIVCNIRLGDILRINHRDYSPIPHWFYRKLIDNTNKKPVFLGQLGNDKISKSLYEKFPEAIFIESNKDPYIDFEILRKSKIKCLSVSTFSYLACWLGQEDTKIHMPLLGFLNHKQRPDINLISSTDQRFIYHDEFAVYNWSNSNSNYNNIINI